MRAVDIRRTYLDFFRERGHKIFPSMPLVPEHPKAPLLTNAGMNQFIPYFLGEKPIEFPRAASCQKCARTIDIEIIGTTKRHMSLFEMMGNFAFGDYYKREAIEWAWELSTGRFGLDPERIWVTVFEDDDEAAGIWRDVIGLPEKRITPRGADDNFWWMGVAGPGGPCSELFYDRGPGYGDLPDFETGERTERIMEFWNLVFTEKEVDGEGRPIRDLPRKNVDTGLGLDRFAALMQEVPGVWETEHIRPLVARAEELTGREYGTNERTDVSLRRIADHARSCSFLIADGVLPSNEARGYIVRRLIRRLVREAKLLGSEDALMPPMVDVVVSVFGESYPELAQNRALVEKVVTAEEEGFRETIRSGLTMLDHEIASQRSSGAHTLPGAAAFKLHDTYGFPFELTLEIAQEAGLEVERDAFEELMQEQRERARAARKEGVTDEEALGSVLTSFGPTSFTGYERDADEAKVVGLVRGTERVRSAREGEEIEVVLDATPFYPEGGGQVGDRGTIETDGARIEILDTQRSLGDLIVHRARVVQGEISEGAAARASVDHAWRAATMRSHTATHVVHATLRGLLGEHARQAGSLVEPGRLRFDFPHFERVPEEVLARLEDEVNRRLIGDDLVRPYETTMDEARNRGAIMLFEEKYGDVVRVVEIGDYSIELCGGTHVTHTSQVGIVKVLGEGSIGSNLRRIEALTGTEAIAGYRTSRALLEHIATLLRATPEEAPARVERLLADLKAAESEIRKAKKAGVGEEARKLVEHAETFGENLVVIARIDDASMAELQSMAVAVRDAIQNERKRPAAVVLASAVNGRAAIVAARSKSMAGETVKARQLIDEAAKALGGGAGGKDDLATGGGNRPDGIDDALRLAREAVRRIWG